MPLDVGSFPKKENKLNFQIKFSSLFRFMVFSLFSRVKKWGKAEKLSSWKDFRLGNKQTIILM